MLAIFPELATCAAQGDIEALGILVRRYFAGSAVHQPMLALRALFENVGIPVLSTRLPGDDFGALIATDDRGRFSLTALLNENVNYSRPEEQFLLAHMLGHYLIHIQTAIARGEWYTSGFKEARSPLRRYEQEAVEQLPTVDEARREEQADHFAVALLLPKGMVLKAVEKLVDHERIAAFFGVTVGCLRRRLMDLEGGTRRPVSFLQAERQLQGGKKSELESTPKQSAPHSRPIDEADIRTPNLEVNATAAKRSYHRVREGSETGSARAKGPADTKSASSSRSQVPEKTGTPIKGMDRIREIARKLDRVGD